MFEQPQELSINGLKEGKDTNGSSEVVGVITNAISQGVLVKIELSGKGSLYIPLRGEPGANVSLPAGAVRKLDDLIEKRVAVTVERSSDAYGLARAFQIKIIAILSESGDQANKTNKADKGNSGGANPVVSANPTASGSPNLSEPAAA